MPVDGAVVVLRNETTGAEMRSTSQKNGIYSFTGLDSSTYTVEAESEQLGRGRLEHIFVSAGHETRVQTAMEFEPSPQEPVQAVIPLPSQPLQKPAVSARSLPDRVQPTPVATAVATAGTVQNVPSAAGQAANPNASSAAGLAVVKPKVAGAASVPAVPDQNQIGLVWGRDRSLAIDEAIAAVMQVVAQLRPAHPRPMQAASRKEDPVTPVVTTKVSGAELQALPASGRRWQDFVLDTPAASTAAGGRAQASLRGAGQVPAESAIDGASIRLAFGGQGGYGPGS
jgi:hypothetical protein